MQLTLEKTALLPAELAARMNRQLLDEQRRGGAAAPGQAGWMRSWPS
ncbi:hypothetical protein P4050_16580 [Pseudomonas aeruginosa]|nr:hypothetical protein [Pseudomonas aeruginosa]